MALFRRYEVNMDVGQAFRDNRQLQQFVLTDVTPTGRILGTGSFGSVEEVMYKRLICAGKRMHELLLKAENEGVPEMIQKYQQECQLMSSLCHPNITQFLGLCFLPGIQLPLLVMERLETSLDDLLENMPNIPMSLKRSILENVVSGLLYLHERNPPVIHRDLTARNILLTSSLLAKITDMGNSRILRPGQVVRTLSALPGTLVYMPPEAQDDTHYYGPSLDVFSFGHLSLFTIIQRFPGELLPSTFLDAGNLQARNEVQRRQQYVEILEALVGRYHPALVELVKECLNNDPEQRPTTDDLLTRLQRMREEVEGKYGYPVKLDMARVKLAKELKLREQQLTQLQDRHEAELRGKTRELKEKTRELEHKTQELEQTTRELEHKTREIEANNVRLAQKNQDIASKDQEIAQQGDMIQQLLHEIELKNEDAQLTREDMSRDFLQELHLRETQLKEELQSKEAEISRLQECLGLLHEAEMVPLKLPLQLKWKRTRDPDMPFGMSGKVQSIQVQGTLYVGGGIAEDGDNDYVVMAYIVSAGKWATLPPYSTYLFAMTAVDNHLLLVGGTGRDNVRSKVLGVWSEDSKKWTHPYPDMTTSRYSCSAVVYRKYLLVFGGVGAGGKDLSSVEVMNTDSKQWYTGRPTPIAWSSMKTAIIGSMCYFMGGSIEDKYSNNVYSVFLPALVSQLDSAQTWRELPHLPVTSAAPLSFSGSLLAVGGWDKDGKAVNAELHLYHRGAGQWVKVADMPTPRYLCTCIMVTDNKLFIAGGWNNGELATINIAQLSPL